MIANRVYRRLVLSNTSVIGINVNPNSIYAAHIGANINCPRLSTMVRYTSTTRNLNKVVIDSNNYAAPNSITGTFNNNTSFIVLNNVLTNRRRDNNHVIRRGNRGFVLFCNVDSRSTVGHRINNITRCHTTRNGAIGLPLQNPIRGATHSVLNNLHSTYACIKTSHLGRLAGHAAFVQIRRRRGHVFGGLWSPGTNIRRRTDIVPSRSSRHLGKGLTSASPPPTCQWFLPL